MLKPNHVAIFALVFLCFASAGPAQEDTRTDEWLKRPVSDATFKAYLDFFSYNSKLPLDEKIYGSEETNGVRDRHFSFVSTAGERVFSRLYSPTGTSSENRRWIILIHGGGPVGKDAGYMSGISRLMVSDGWEVLAFDLKHWGERKTDLLQSYAEKEKHDRLYNQPAVYLAWVTQTVKDVRRTVDFLIEKMDASSDRIVLVGFSRGAVLASVVGGVEDRLAGVALIHGGHFDRYENGHLPAACPANYIGRISPRPLLMINGKHDQDFLMDSQVLPLQNLAKEPKLMIWGDTGHGQISESDRTRFLKWLREIVE